MKGNEITNQIIGSAIEVHRLLGPGLLESAYERCLSRELELRGLRFQQQVALPVVYKGVALDCGYRLDLLIEDQIVVEIKAVETLSPIHEAQVLTYLRLGGWPIGLLINFHVPCLKDGVKRLVYQWHD
jgi:GxxExxY protein